MANYFSLQYCKLEIFGPNLFVSKKYSFVYQFLLVLPNQAEITVEDS